MGSCSEFLVLVIVSFSLSLPLLTSSNGFEDIALQSNATILNYATQLENSALYRYLSTSRTPVQGEQSVGGIDLVRIIAADMENNIRNLEDVLKVTASQLEEHYASLRSVPCCYDNCHSSQQSACFLACRKNMTSLIEAYKYVNREVFLDNELEGHPNFERSINTSQVALYIPTNILVDGHETLCSLEWMDVLGDLFKSNWKNTTVGDIASYQYFASANGSMAFFPASNWVRSNPCPRCPDDAGDSYDARQRPWYTQTVQGSTYLVILLDMSGSMTGFRSLLARLASAELLKSLTENDYFYVIRVDSNPRAFGYLNRTRASRANILSMNSLITNAAPTSTAGTANFGKAFELSFEALNESTECHVAMVIFADDDAKMTDSDVRKYATVAGQQVRIFTYQVGTSGKNQQLEDIATNNGGIFRQLMDYTDIFPAVNDFGWEMRRYASQVNSSVFFSRYRDTFGSLVLSLSTPVIHHGNTSSFLGVMGVDLPLKSLSHIIQRQVGTLGYGFVVDNNGQLVTHPLLKEGWPLLIDGLVSLDMERFEVPDQVGALMPVRQAMLHREVGCQSIVAWAPANRMQRTHYIQRNTTYCYSPINGTGFSVAIVIPSEVVLQRGRNVSGKSLATAGSVAGYLVLEDLPYCSPAQLFEWGLDPTTQPGPFLEKLSSLITSGSSIQCDKTMCASLLADYATVRNISLEPSEASESWFVQFSSGLTWCLHNGTNSSNVTCDDLASTSYLHLTQGTNSPVLIGGVASSTVLVTPINALSDIPAAAVVGKLVLRPQLLLLNTSNKELGFGELLLLDNMGYIVAATSGTQTTSCAELSTAVMEILYTTVNFTGFELTPCSLSETTAGYCKLSQTQTSCEAFAKDFVMTSTCSNGAPMLCYTNLTLYSLQMSFQNWSGTSPAAGSITTSLRWARLYGHTLLVAGNNITAASVNGRGVFPTCDCLYPDCDVYRVQPVDLAVCDTTVVNTGASEDILPHLGVIVSAGVHVLTLLWTTL